MHARIQFSDQAMGDKIYIKVFAPVIMEHISTLYKKLFTYKPVLDADDLVLYRREPRYISMLGLHRGTSWFRRENKVAYTLIKLWNLLRFIEMWIHTCKSQWVHRLPVVICLIIHTRSYSGYLVSTVHKQRGDSITIQGAAGLTITCW